MDVFQVTNLNLDLAGLIEGYNVRHISLVQKAIKNLLEIQMYSDLNKDTLNQNLSCDL